MEEFRYREETENRSKAKRELPEWPLPKKVGVKVAVILGIPILVLILIVLWMILMQFFPFLAPR